MEIQINKKPILTKAENREIMDEYLSCAMDIGQAMLQAGAEINRVEDTIDRICRTYGAEEVDVFSTSYVIIATLRGSRFGSCTQTRRASPASYNLEAVAAYNNLSRILVNQKPDVEEIQYKITEIKKETAYPNWVIMISYAIISAAFTIFFGGNFRDALLSAAIGLAIRLLEISLQSLSVNRFLRYGACAFLAGCLSILSVRFGFGTSVDKISIGNIMVLISGLLFTNSIRDMFMDNFITGGISFISAIFVALVIGFGFAMSTLLFL